MTKNLPTGPEGPKISLSALTRAPFSMVVTNPALEDNPIVYVNRAFEEVTGYSSAASIGRNCRFLQGPDTSEESIQTLRDAVEETREVAVDILNYRADGSQFWNRLMIAPITADTNGVPYFLGVQMALDDESSPKPDRFGDDVEKALVEVQHRVKNHLSMIVSLIRVQARRSKTEARQQFDTLSRRVEALQLLYEEFAATAEDRGLNDQAIALGAYLSRVANAIAYLDGRRGVRVNIDADSITVPFEAATRVGLILSEVMTNAMQHAFSDREQGLVDIRIKELSNGVIRLQVADDGGGIPDGTTWPSENSLGGRIVKQLIEGLEAQLSVAKDVSGTLITIDIPSEAVEIA